TLLLQLASLAVIEPARRDRTIRVSQRRASLFFVSLGASAAVFASIGLLFWFQGDWGGRLFGVMILAGAAVNVALQARASTRQLWIGCAPFMLMLVGLPFASLAEASGPSRGVMALAGVAAVLFVLHIAVAGRRSVESARELGRALYEAQRERLRAEAANAAKSEFLAVMSHELRTPLNGVLGMAQVMETDELTPKQRGRLEVVRRSGEALLVLLNDLLDISRIEAAKLELDDGLVDLKGLVAHTQCIYEPLAQAKNLGLRLRLLESAGGTRAGDPARVRQVLHNLVGNAIKFTESGRVTVMISGSAEELVFDVTDTGPGIAADRLATMFERFSQSDLSASRRHGGSGLGLAVTRGLARLMGGDLLARSELGEGSVFTARLMLPLAQAPAAAWPQPEPAAEAAPADPQPDAPVAEGEGCIRVLAAEDNPTNQLVLKTLLEQVGIAAHVVNNGEEALEAWRSAPWDLVLMDIQMPIMDGLAATRSIRAVEAAERRPRTPIIAVTANATANQAAEYMDAGMDGLVPKPIQFAQLVAVISGAMDPAEAAEVAAAGRSAA
ncbi:MAG: sensor histidine kinase, partial [Phenylobacterium sp.]|nr:sensor histidine kinase [Phenylobacterium sp.]